MMVVGNELERQMKARSVSNNQGGDKATSQASTVPSQFKVNDNGLDCMVRLESRHDGNRVVHGQHDHSKTVRRPLNTRATAGRTSSKALCTVSRLSPSKF